MAEITITPAGTRKFVVDIRERGLETSHVVTAPERIDGGPEIGEGDLERAVRASVHFLLEREPASSILQRFSLSDIASYFPEYPQELARRLA